TSLTSTSANIAWDTNLFSDSKVEIGETTNYELVCATCASSSFVKTHNITVGGLSAGRTYHYRVISKTETGETKTSLDRTFTTPTSSSDTTAPSITYMAAEVTGSNADIIIHTTEDSHVTVYYSLNQIVDLFGPGVLTANDNAVPYRILHTIGLSGLSLSTTYHYRVQAVDPSNNSFTTGEFTFTTAGAGDYVFTTGVCAGGVPIGGCTAEQYYCDAGTAALIHNCEHCGYVCPTGQTCLPGGVCSTDPTLTDDPYQCNRAECYKNCQGIAPAQSCVSDAECPGVPCVDDGVFNSPAPSNCFSTYPRCDANVILKVKRDRECDKWLECGTAIEQVDPKTGQKEEVCMDLAACTAMGENNQCTSYVDLPKEEVTFRTPDEIKSIKWLTGAITAGLDWQYEAGAPIIRGFFPWSSMSEVGEKLKIENYNFEKTYTSTEPVERTEEGVYGGRGDVYPPLFMPGPKWIKYPDVDDNDTTISVEWDPVSGAKAKENHALLINNMNDINQGGLR
ncbi:MAG: fibronectin type III domain-containing protein, partial [Planctomycetota bacterium]